MTFSTLSVSSSADASTQLRVDGVSHTFGAHRVLTDITFTVPPGDRVGMIGENGSGKSTLLRILAGTLTADAGTVRAIASGGDQPRIGLLHQEPPFSPSESIASSLEAAIAPIRAAVDEVDRRARSLADHPEDSAAADAYALALDAAERADAWDVDARVDAMLAGMGLAEIPRDRLSGTLSGGQRARLSLAWVLLNAPDVLLLDEPTNHLDDQATEHLLRVLERWRGPVVFASHDRAFLDEAATALIDLDPAPRQHADTDGLVQDGTGTAIGVTRFTGAYSDYLTARADERRRWEQRYRDEQAELSRLRAAVRTDHVVGHADWKPRTEQRGAQKFYSDRNAKVVSRRVNDSRSRLEVLEARQIRKPPAELRFAGLTAAVRWDDAGSGKPTRPRLGRAALPGPIITATGLEVSDRLARIDLAVSSGERWLLTGPNGSGKSTLLHALSGRIAPNRGGVTVREGVRIGMLEQDVDLPDPHGRGPARTVTEAYLDGVGAARAEAVPLATFGLIAGRDAHRPVGELSVGQQRRLALATLLADPPELLMLDEPTNHLSLTLVDAIEAAIAEFPGTVIIASHDRWLRRRWEGRVIALD